MRYITTMSTLLGKRDVTSNQADWQFGSSRFSRLCLWLSLPNQSASQMTDSAAKTAPIATTFSPCNLMRQIDRSSKHLKIKIVNLTCIVSSLPLSRLLCLCASLTLLCSSGLAMIMGHCLPFVILPLTAFTRYCIAITTSQICWARR